jgi:hypothetical protein
MSVWFLIVIQWVLLIIGVALAEYAVGRRVRG